MVLQLVIEELTFLVVKEVGPLESEVLTEGGGWLVSIHLSFTLQVVVAETRLCVM